MVYFCSEKTVELDRMVKMMKKQQFSEIPGFDTWVSVELLSKGWSTDKKYIVKTKAGEKLLLRIADAESFEQKKKEYDIICKYATLGFEMSKPLSFGLCDNGQHTYILLTWVEGEDLEEALPKLTEEEQYQLGRSAGRILKQIHSIPVAQEDIPAQTKKAKKLMQLERYEQSAVRIPGDETAVQYVKDNIDKLWLESPVYMHGDFHPGNLILTSKKTLGVIDFNRWEVGDPYEEFYKLESFGVEVSAPYCIGQIDAYFNDKVPMPFWETLAVYVAHASLFSIKWTEKFGQKEIDGMVRRCRAAMEHYDGFTKVVPSWYDAGLK